MTTRKTSTIRTKSLTVKPLTVSSNQITKEQSDQIKSMLTNAIFDLEKELRRVKLQERCSHKLWTDIQHETLTLDSRRCCKCNFVHYTKSEKL